MTETTEKANLVISHADRVMARLDARSGIVRDARKRELQRLNQGLVSTLTKIGLAVGVISVATIIIGLVAPIGMFGFLAAVGLAIGALSHYRFIAVIGVGVIALLLLPEGRRALRDVRVWTAIAVGATISTLLTIPAAVYSAFMFISAGLFARFMYHRNNAGAASVRPEE